MSGLAQYLAPNRCGCCGQSKRAWYWTPERMVVALQAWVEKHGRLPSTREWRRGLPEYPAYSTVTDVFGCWNNLVRAAGFSPHKSGQRPWSKDEIAEAMLDHLLHNGRWPRSDEWRFAPKPDEPRRPVSDTVRLHFGTWDAGRRYAGWTGKPPEAYEEPRCADCDTELENMTLGCKTCSDRFTSRSRRQRKAETAAATRTGEATVSDERKVAA